MSVAVRMVFWNFKCLGATEWHIGIPFALKTGRSGGVALSIGISVMIGFLYGIVFYVFVSFGNAGILPPIPAC